jgi:DNA-binding CsgD family transcriptional regulator
MVDSFKVATYLWEDVRSAIMNKETEPVAFQRVYIGKLEAQAHSPVHMRRSCKERAANEKATILLGEPYNRVALTPREAQVLSLICRGCTNLEAAEYMGLSPRTTEYYIKNMRKKTRTNSKVHLVKEVLKTDFMQRMDKTVRLEVD